MTNASKNMASSPFPPIRQETIYRLSSEADARLTLNLPKRKRQRYSWLMLTLGFCVFLMEWPFK